MTPKVAEDIIGADDAFKNAERIDSMCFVAAGLITTLVFFTTFDLRCGNLRGPLADMAGSQMQE